MVTVKCASNGRENVKVIVPVARCVGPDPVPAHQPGGPLAVVGGAVGLDVLALAVLQVVLELAGVLGAVEVLENALAAPLALLVRPDVQRAVRACGWWVEKVVVE